MDIHPKHDVLCLQHYIHIYMLRDHFCMRPANERRRYNVTSSRIGWAHTQNDPCIIHFHITGTYTCICLICAMHIWYLTTQVWVPYDCSPNLGDIISQPSTFNRCLFLMRDVFPLFPVGGESRLATANFYLSAVSHVIGCRDVQCNSGPCLYYPSVQNDILVASYTNVDITITLRFKCPIFHTRRQHLWVNEHLK